MFLVDASVLEEGCQTELKIASYKIQGCKFSGFSLISDFFTSTYLKTISLRIDTGG